MLHTVLSIIVLISSITVLYESYRTAIQLIKQMQIQHSYMFIIGKIQHIWTNTVQLCTYNRANTAYLDKYSTVMQRRNVTKTTHCKSL